MITRVVRTRHMDDPSASIADHYDELAEDWETITTGPAKEHVVLPALESLLPDLAGTRVLDAGCGDGHYASWLADRGAEVVGVDVSEEMVAVARERHGDAAEFHRGDLDGTLAFADDGAFDLVCCQHVFSHLPSLDATLSEFARVLRPGGDLVVASHHPFHDFLITREEEYPDTTEALNPDLDPVVVPDETPPNYHETERFRVHWAGPDSQNPGTYYRRPLERLLQPLLDAGFDLREVVEPTPDETFEREYPDLARELRHRPSRAICLRAER